MNAACKRQCNISRTNLKLQRMAFNEQFSQDGAWRQEFSGRLKLLARWMTKQGLCNEAVQERLQQLDVHVRSDKVMVAFVAQCPHSKSELIDAIFFTGPGRGILPAGAGRATLCPTELGYDPDLAPSVRLLPIETRLEPQALMAWRRVPDKWLPINLDAGNAGNAGNAVHLAESLHTVNEIQQVSPERARALGFWRDATLKGHPPIAPDGRVPVPKWRHALVNIAHPLFKEGLVILDMPELNAIGAEPELMASLIGPAQAVVFVLSADTGVTQPDLTIWHEHLGVGGKGSKGGQIRLVVLNKTDTLEAQWGTPAQAQAQIDRLKADTAASLDLPLSQIVAVSAQQGLVAKITQDAALLQASQLPALEELLEQYVFRPHQDARRAAVIAEIGKLRSEADRIIDLRQRGLAEQIRELHGLKAKNSGMVSQVRNRVAREQAEFAGSSARVSAVRAVHHALLAQAVDLLSVSALKADLAELLDALKPPGVKLNMKKIYRQTFFLLRERLHKGQAVAAEIKIMLDSAFEQANAEFGFSLQAGQAPDLARHVNDLDLVELSYLRYLGLGNVIRLVQADFPDRLVRALSSRLGTVFELALGEVALCSRTASAQLDTHVFERRHTFARHLEAAERIEQAGAALGERIAELESQESMQKLIADKLAGLTARLLDRQPELVAAIPLSDKPHTFTALAALT